VKQILGVIKRNPLFSHSISCKNNGFLFTTPNITGGTWTFPALLTIKWKLFCVTQLIFALFAFRRCGRTLKCCSCLHQRSTYLYSWWMNCSRRDFSCRTVYREKIRTRKFRVLLLQREDTFLLHSCVQQFSTSRII